MNRVSKYEVATATVLYVLFIAVSVAYQGPPAVFWALYGLSWWLAYRVGRHKGRVRLGFWAGFLAGWLGLLVVALTTKTREKKVAEARERMRIEHEARLPSTR